LLVTVFFKFYEKKILAGKQNNDDDDNNERDKNIFDSFESENFWKCLTKILDLVYNLNKY